MKVVYFLFVLCSPIIADDSFLQWAQHYGELQNQTACRICEILPMSNTSQLPWWVSPLQGTDWHSLYTCISEIMYNPKDTMFFDGSTYDQ